MKRTSVLPNGVELAVLQQLCSSVNSPFSLKVYLLAEHREWSQLLDLEIDPGTYRSARRFRNDFLVASYLSKWVGWDNYVVVDKKRAALGKFSSAEERNRETTYRLRNHSHVPNMRAERILFLAQRKISEILGPFSLREALARCEWSGGATFDLLRGTPLRRKMTQAMSVTGTAIKYLQIAAGTDPHWVEAITGFYPDGPVSLCSLKVVRGAKIVTVPKNAKTDRVIAKEPTGNAFLQQGVRNYMTERLKRFGIRLDDQSINQNLARIALREDLATVDLSAASDTITTELVYNLLPIDWVLYLDDIRSPELLVDGAWSHQFKFSSMGNAFTFPLETLIFWSLTWATHTALSEPTTFVSAYGDDIICAGRCYEELKFILEYVGFEVNAKKSHAIGYYRESCGKHYFDGADVTPVYQKHRLTEGLHEQIRAANRLVRWSLMHYRAWRFLTKGAHELISQGDWQNGPRIPFGPSDDAYLVPDVVLRDLPFDRNHGYLCRVWVFEVVSRNVRDQRAYYAYKLRNPSFSNTCPNGHCTEIGRGKWKARRRWVSPFSTL